MASNAGLWASARQLRRAAQEIGRIAERLNATTNECPTCHLNVAESFDEKQWRTQLDAVVRKLDGIAGSMDRLAKERREAKHGEED